MSVLFIGKRFYTNRDALLEKYGRIWQLPWRWANTGIPTRLWLVDYHTCEAWKQRDGELDIICTSVRTLAVFRRFVEELRSVPRPDVIVASGDCYIGLMAYRLAQRLGARFVFDVYDKYDEFVAYARLPKFDLFSFLLGRADANLFASRMLLDQLGRSSRDLLVQNGIETKHFYPRDMATCRAALGLAPDIKIIGYFGSMDRDRGIDDLIEAQQLLRTSGFEIELLLAGKARNDLSLDWPGVRYLGNLKYESVPRALACCDLLALPYRRSTYLDAASSCKIAEYMAMRRPIVATRTPNMAENFPRQTEQLDDLLAVPGDHVDLAGVIRKQFTVRKIVDLPEEMDWSEIASITRSSLKITP